MQRTTTLLTSSLWAGIFMLIVASRLGFTQLPINLWSRAYLQRAKQMEVSDLPTAPTTHQMAATWLAHDALDQGNLIQAEKFLGTGVNMDGVFVLRVLGYIRLGQGKVDEAIAAWQKAGDVVSLQGLKQSSLDNGNFDSADQAFRALVDLQALDMFWPYADFLAHQMKDYAAAEAFLKKAIEKYPNKIEVWSYYLGDLLQEQKRWNEAKAAYQTALSVNPQGYWILLQLGSVTYYNQDGIEQAISWLEKAIKIAPEQGNAYYQIGYILATEGMYNQAEKWLAKAIEIDPYVPWWYVIRGNAARQSGNLPLALSVYQAGLELFPDFAPLYLDLAFAYRLNGQAEEALTAIQKALFWMEQPDTNYYARAGSIYEWAGNKEQALEYFQQALLIDPKNAGALQGVERLSK